MTIEYLVYSLLSLLVSFLIGFAAIPRIIDFCVKHRLYDQPDGMRKVHTNNIPRLGGICFMPSMLIALLIGVYSLNVQTDGRVGINMSMWSCMFFISLMMIYIVGVIDDLVGLGAKIKFAVQIVAATLLAESYLYINTFHGLLGIGDIPPFIGIPITVLVIVFIINAINLIDGIDGLSSSLGIIAMSGFLYIFLQRGMHIYAMLVAGVIGVLIAFAYYNVFGREDKNRKVFMGDSGSLTIGFMLGFLFIKCTMFNEHSGRFTTHDAVLAYSLLIVPVYDVARVILVRLRHGHPLFNADKNHIHHKLLRCGLNQHQSLLVLIALALTFIIVNVCLSTVLGQDINVVVASDIILWLLFQCGVNHAIRANGQQPYQEIKPTV